MFKKILIANRGEIAVRVIRACKEWGIATVAVHSDVDRESMHVRLADESVCIGSHQPANSYLNIPALMSAIELTKAEAVHPGYGFLSENANFAKVLEENNIKFIGASSKLIEMMGDKIQAKKIAKEHGLPVIEGSEGGITDIKAAKELCKKIGFPVLIKASAGGGGKGMKIVRKEEEFETLFLELTEKVLANEKGALLYTITRSKSNSQDSVVMEQYRSAADIDAHGKADYFLAANKAMAGLVAAAPVIEVLDVV